jgi:hypothetical protein
MEPKGSSPYTQEPATCPYPESDIVDVNGQTHSWVALLLR